MNFGLLNISAFKKYRNEINTANYHGFIIGGGLFMAFVFTIFIARLIVCPEDIRWSLLVFFISYAVLYGAVVFFSKIIKKKTYVVSVIWLVSGMIILTHIGILFSQRYVFIVYSLMMLAYSLFMILEPSFHIASQIVLCTAVSFVAYFTNDGMIETSIAFKNITVSLVATIVGVYASYLRVENIVFKSEIMNLTNAGVSFDEKNEALWDERNKMGIMGMSTEEKRKYFYFSANLSKKMMMNIRKKNVFSISDDMPWDAVRERIMNMTADRGSRGQAGRFLDAALLLEKFKNGKDVNSIILPFITDDNELRWFSIECTMKNHPVTGDLVGMFLVEDVSNDHMLMDILNVIINGVYESVIIEDIENKSVMRFTTTEDGIYGTYEPDFDVLIAAMIREHVADYDIEKAYRNGSLEIIVKELNEKGTHEFLLDEIDSSGHLHVMEYKYAYIKPYNRQVIGTKQDITSILNKDKQARREIEAAITEKEAAMQAKEEFLTRMSHELRTPMNAILGLATLMADEINNKKALQGYISKVEYSGNFLLKLINDMLDMSKLSDNQFIIKKEPYEINEFWQTVNMMIGPLAQTKKLDVEYEFSIPSELVVMTDPMRLTQIFVNLLNNSVKYTEEGGHVYFKCSEVTRTGNKTRLSFVVKDDGIGMSEEFKKRMFEPFAQESQAVMSTLSGTGLGLSIVKGIIEAMGGSITVDSTVGVGTEITVLLDFEISDTKVEKKKKVEKIELSGMKVLVVEDNEINREIAEAILHKKNIVVETANDGKEGLERFTASEPGYYDAILMDIRMPVMNGLQATREIRALERTDAKSIPIIAMTANAFDSDIQASADAGLDLHLSKPIEPMKLYETLERFKRLRTIEE